MNPLAKIRAQAAWLLDPELGTCIVGSSALAEACHRAKLEGPVTHDLDLAWALDVDAGQALLEQQGVYLETTVHNRERGTLAFKLGSERIEITSFRSPSDQPTDLSLADRVLRDLGARDMTVGALSWWLSEDTILDPHDGLRHWQEQRVEPVGDAATRIAEHPIRWIRYYRKAHTWGFDLSNKIRNAEAEFCLLEKAPKEAIAAEFRLALLELKSPGRFFLELHERGLLEQIAPELALQFDGRPAGPVRHHPEVGQGLHLILSLEWTVEHTRALPEEDRMAVILAVLCHDFGKGLTESHRLPSHHGHEEEGIAPIRSFLDRMPGLAERKLRRFVEQVCRLHLHARGLRKVRKGTAARYYEVEFRDKSFRTDLFALALGADCGGRLGKAAEGQKVRALVEAEIGQLIACCSSVDAAELHAKSDGDIEKFKNALHEARARSIRW